MRKTHVNGSESLFYLSLSCLVFSFLMCLTYGPEIMQYCFVLMGLKSIALKLDITDVKRLKAQEKLYKKFHKTCQSSLIF